MGTLRTEVGRAEAIVRAWLRALDAPLTSREQGVAIGLGLRGVALYRGFIHACSGPTPTIAAAVDLRALIDLIILVRWIEANPQLHVDMWLADDVRQQLTLGEAWTEMHRHRGSSAGPAFTAEEVDEKRGTIDRVRAAAIKAGQRLKRSGPILPSLEQMSHVTPDLFEAYDVAYRSLSPSSHSGGRAFVNDMPEQRADGWHVKPAAVWDAMTLRALGIPLMCFLVASVSRQVGLGLDADADALRREFAKWQIPAGSGAGEGADG